MKRVFIVHGWDGSPEDCWIPWLKKELELKGYEVVIPRMPDSKAPEVNSWVSFLRNNVGEVDEETYFVGHSIGCQTILRYLETLPDNVKVGGIVMVAGWTNLIEESYEGEEDRAIARPWIETPLSWDMIKEHVDKVVAIFSDNDEFVPLGDAKVFEEKLGAKVILENNKGHFDDASNVKELTSALDALLGM